MPTAAKAQTIEQTKEKYNRSRGVLFTEYRGMSVKQLQALRKELKSKGGEVAVVKNTLFKIAAGEDGQNIPENLSSGPTAIAFIYENEADCAKALMDFAKTNKNLVIKGGLIQGKPLDAAGVDALSKLPPRDILISQVIGAIAAPLTNLVGVIEALYGDPIRVIGAVADKMNEGEAPAETASAPSEPEPAPAEEAAPEVSAAEEAAPTENPES
ncbi:MAG: 50S ribosomal protein L10 [Fimbriimonadaceae bacterium]|jgi:large subunit ribosomal protein L10|nr:50S ribosomal protein L10 [Fimbriimonadaceae bacterium]